MIVLPLFNKLLELFILIFLGFFLVKIKILKTEDSKILSTLVLYLISPCTILYAFHMEPTDEVKKGLTLAFGAAIGIHILYLIVVEILTRIFKLNNIDKASLIYTNSGNLIYPIVISVLGREWLIYASGYIVIQILFLWSHGRMVICEERKFEPKKILFNINFIAAIVGLFLFLFGLQIPELPMHVIDTLASMVAPICMLVAGMLMAGVEMKKLVRDKKIYLMIFLKMILCPLIALIALKVSGAASLVPNGDTILLITLFASIAPTAVSIMQMAQVYDKDSEYASALFFITTVTSIVTMPVMVYLYQM